MAEKHPEGHFFENLFKQIQLESQDVEDLQFLLEQPGWKVLTLKVWPKAYMGQLTAMANSPANPKSEWMKGFYAGLINAEIAAKQAAHPKPKTGRPSTEKRELQSRERANRPTLQRRRHGAVSNLV
jgi:hypothetical protein